MLNFVADNYLSPEKIMSKYRVCRVCGQRLADGEDRCSYCGGRPRGHSHVWWPATFVILIAGAVAAVCYLVADKTTAPDTGIRITPAFTERVAAYTQLQPFSNGRAAVRNAAGRWGYIDSTGVEVIPCLYDHASTFSGGAAQVKDGRTLLYIDLHGNRLDGPKANSRPAIDSRFSVFREEGPEGKYGIADSDGHIVVEALYDSLSHVAEGLAVAVIYRPEVRGIDITAPIPALPDTLDLNALDTPIAYVTDSALTAATHRTLLYGYVDMHGNTTFSADDIENAHRQSALLRQFTATQKARKRLDDRRLQLLDEQRRQLMRDSLDALIESSIDAEIAASIE